MYHLAVVHFKTDGWMDRRTTVSQQQQYCVAV